jgi:hypothetical protein
MTKRFEHAVAEIRKLPDEQQDHVADLMLELARSEDFPKLTPEQVEGVRHARGQAERGELASDESVKRLLHKPWA